MFNLKKEFLSCLNGFRNIKTDELRKKMVKARFKYSSCARKCRYDHDRHITLRLQQTEKSNIREFWKILQPKNKNRSENACSLTLNDFGKYFKTLGHPDDVVYIADDDVYEYLRSYNDGNVEVLYEELNYSITTEETINAIKGLKYGKSAGPDMLINEFYINACGALTDKLTLLFNIVLNSGYFPNKWTEVVIVPIHKKRSKTLVDNYRGVTLLSTLGKLFTRLLNNRLSFWADTYSILIEEQYGLRSGRSTVDSIFVLNSLLNLALSKGENIYCSFIDFRKAFDYLNRDCLWYKMLHNGIRGKIIDMIRSMYSEVKSRVKYLGRPSEDFHTYLGVRQGESSSPFLFSLYVNDLK